MVQPCAMMPPVCRSVSRRCWACKSGVEGLIAFKLGSLPGLACSWKKPRPKITNFNDNIHRLACTISIRLRACHWNAGRIWPRTNCLCDQAVLTPHLHFQGRAFSDRQIVEKVIFAAVQGSLLLGALLANCAVQRRKQSCTHSARAPDGLRVGAINQRVWDPVHALPCQ